MFSPIRKPPPRSGKTFCAAAVYSATVSAGRKERGSACGGMDRRGTHIADRAGQAFTLEPSGRDIPQALMGASPHPPDAPLDARWYAHDVGGYRVVDLREKKKPRSTPSLAPGSCANGTSPAVVKASSVLDIFRAAAIAREFGLDMRVVGTGAEYERIDGIARAGVKLMIPAEYPDPPEVTPEGPSLRDLRRWDFAPENAARLERAGIRFAFTSYGMKKPEDFLKNVRIAVARGLSPEAALRALTVVPASFLGANRLSGTLEPGMLANVIVADGDIFTEKTKILDVWVAGKRYEVNPVPEVDPRGTWILSGGPGGGLGGLSLEIGGEAATPSAKIFRPEKKDKKFPAVKTTLDARLVTVAFAGDSSASPVGTSRRRHRGRSDVRRGAWTDGRAVPLGMHTHRTLCGETEPVKKTPRRPAEIQCRVPGGPDLGENAPEQPIMLIRNATVWTCGPKGIVKNGDILVRKGKIAEVGARLSAPEGAVVIDAAGKHVTPGLIDAHSHIAIRAGINEATHSVTSETRIGDVIESDDVNIFRQLAGGLTTSCINHGSANLIGGQNALIKLRWGALPEEMLLEGAWPMQKFALGENPKQSNVQGPPTTRYPATRMGVEELLRDSFRAAIDYKKEWNAYEAGVKKNRNVIPPSAVTPPEPLVESSTGNARSSATAYLRTRFSRSSASRGVALQGGAFHPHSRGIQGAESMRAPRRNAHYVQRLVDIQSRGLRRHSLQRRAHARSGAARELQFRRHRTRAPAEHRGGKGGEIRRRTGGGSPQVRHHQLRETTPCRPSHRGHRERQGRRHRRLDGRHSRPTASANSRGVDVPQVYRRRGHERALVSSEKKRSSYPWSADAGKEVKK